MLFNLWAIAFEIQPPLGFLLQAVTLAAVSSTEATTPMQNSWGTAIHLKQTCHMVAFYSRWKPSPAPLWQRSDVLKVSFISYFCQCVWAGMGVVSQKEKNTFNKIINNFVCVAIFFFFYNRLSLKVLAQLILVANSWQGIQFLPPITWCKAFAVTGQLGRRHLPPHRLSTQ